MKNLKLKTCLIAFLLGSMSVFAQDDKVPQPDFY